MRPAGGLVPGKDNMPKLYKVIKRKRVTMINRRMRKAKDAIQVETIATDLTFDEAKAMRKTNKQFEIVPQKGTTTDEPTN